MRQQAGNKLIGFIVDLRNNPGGSFDAAVKAADAFIDKGDITVVKSRKADEHQADRRDPRRPRQWAADRRAGQRRHRARGRTGRRRACRTAAAPCCSAARTFGESAIESVIPLNGNGAIRLTTARFLTPSGRRSRARGSNPTSTCSPLKLEKVAQADRRREADLRGALKNPDPIGPSSKPPTERPGRLSPRLPPAI